MPINLLIKNFLFYKHELNFSIKINSVIKNSNNQEEIKILEKFKNEGFFIIENILNKEQLEKINYELNDKFKLDSTSKENRVGGIRFPNVEKNFPELKNYFFSNDQINKILLIFYDNYHNYFQKLVYQKSYYDQKVSNLDKKKIGLGREWHCDSWKNEIKLMMFLNDITIDNGPLEIIPGSNIVKKNPIRKQYLKNIFKTIYPSNFNSDLLYFDQISDNIEKKKIVGKAGSIAIFNTRLLHRASFLKKGFRDVIWAYFK